MYRIWYKVFIISIIAGMVGCGSQNNTAISATDTVDHTTLSKPPDIAINIQSNELFVSNNLKHSILVFKSTDNGNALPARVMSGTNTLLNKPVEIAMDKVDDEVYITNTGNNSITVYSRTANGNTAPLRIIKSPAKN